MRGQHSIKVGNYIRRKTRYEPEVIFAHLDEFKKDEQRFIARDGVDGMPTHFRLDGDYIKGNNKNRYRTFQKSLTCAGCGLVGEYFFKERYPDSSTWHLNLYGVKNGEEVLFTKDHIRPKSKGGGNTLNNLQTMCYECNHDKANMSQTKFMKKMGNPIVNMPMPREYPDMYGPGTVPNPIIRIPHAKYMAEYTDVLLNVDPIELTESQQKLANVINDSDLLEKTLTDEEKSGRVLCIDCKHFSKNNTKCAYERVVDIDYVKGVKIIEAVDCYTMNKDGNCPHFDI